jgi:AraC family transcriptional regulator
MNSMVHRHEPLSASAPRVQVTPSNIARRHGISCGAVSVDAVEMMRREPFDYRFKSSNHLLIMSERAARDDGETLVEGLPKSNLREFSHKMTLIPAGHEFYGWQKPRTLTRVTYIYIDPKSPLLASGPGNIDKGLKPRLFFFDEDLWHTAAKLKAQAENPGQDYRSYGESLSLILVHETMRLDKGAPASVSNARGGLAGWQKKHVHSYIEEHLAENISLVALAELARLSPFHFARAFKQSFNVPPHRYLSTRRIERAKQLLVRPELSVTQIGLNVGFADTSSFTAAFRKHAGVTPTAFRRSNM